MFAININTILEIISAVSSVAVLVSMFLFANLMTNVIEKRVASLHSENKELKSQNEDLQNKLNAMEKESETDKNIIDQIVKEKDALNMKYHMQQIQNDYYTNLEKENAQLEIKVLSLEKRLEKSRDEAKKEGRRRKQEDNDYDGIWTEY